MAFSQVINGSQYIDQEIMFYHMHSLVKSSLKSVNHVDVADA